MTGRGGGQDDGRCGALVGGFVDDQPTVLRTSKQFGGEQALSAKDLEQCQFQLGGPYG